MTIKTVNQAIGIARQADELKANGCYHQALIILAKEVKRLQDKLSTAKAEVLEKIEEMRDELDGAETELAANYIKHGVQQDALKAHHDALFKTTDDLAMFFVQV